MQLPKVPTHREGTDLAAFSLEVNNMVGHLQATSAASRLQDQMLLDRLVSKLPDARRERWHWHLRDNLYDIADVPRFANWLSTEAAIVRRSHESNQQANVRSIGPTPRKIFAIQMQSQPGCAACGEPHRTRDCPEIANLDEAQRWEMVKANHLCFSCLGGRHTTRECRTSR